LRRAEWLAICVAFAITASVSGWVASRPPQPVHRTGATDANDRSRGDAVRSPATPTTTNSTTPSPTGTAGGGSVALSELVVDTAPPGFTELGPGVGPSGPFDAEAFVRLSATPEYDRALLSGSRFRSGYARSWQAIGAGGPRRIVASVFEFEQASDAVVVLMRKREQTVMEYGGVEFPVASGIGLRFVHHEGGQRTYGYTVAFHHENLLFYLGAMYPSAQPPDEILEIEARQRERLTGARVNRR
jgi:hypothetical protein